jgi:Uma2 family endonuclease
LAAIFEAVFGNKGEAGTEFMYRPRLEFEFRVAEVAWLSRERAETIDLDDSLRGVPEIVVEVLSPSNSALEVLRKRELCFGSNCEQFWIIDTESKLIEIYLTGGAVCTYRPGERIPLGGTTIAVDDIFDF